MVNNINGLTPTQNNASRSREKPPQLETNPGSKDSGASNRDQVDLSPEAKNLQEIESNLSRLPEVDQERVSHIKNALREGSYSVDPSRLAAKIAQFELNL